MREQNIKIGKNNNIMQKKQNKRKKIIILCSVFAAILLLSGGYVINKFILQNNNNIPSNTKENNSNVNPTENDQNNTVNETENGTSTSTSVTDINRQNENNNDNNNKDNEEPDNNINVVDDGGPHHGASSVSMQNTKDAEQYMQSHDTNKLKNIATGFLKSFFNYDRTTLKNGSWLSSCSAYVDQDGIKNDTDNIVYKRIADTEWCKRMSKYKLFNASVDSVEVINVYATKSESEKQGSIGEYHPVVDINIVYNITDEEPGNAAWWDGLTKRKAEYLVNFTQNDKISSISKISDKEIKTIRDSSYMSGVSQ